MTGDAAHATLGAKLAAAAWEAGQVARFGLDLQDALGALAPASALAPVLASAPGDARSLQGLDLLVQHAQGLQGFLLALAGLCRAEWQVPAEAASFGLLLDAQRRRLALEPPQADACAGLCELF